MAAKSIHSDDYQHIDRPIGAMSKEFPDDFRMAPHFHERAQLVYAVAGVMEISVDGGTWILPPQRALWIPGGIEHAMVARGAISLRTLYVREEAAPFQRPQGPQAIKVSSLLRELILRAVAMPLDYDENGRDGRILSLLLDEVEWTDEPVLHIPAPLDARLRRVCDLVRRNPAENRTLEELAPLAGASGRTLTRLARLELGVPFLHWRRQVRLLEALPRLVSGEQITSIAMSLGYETPSAFTEMFHKTMGTTPSKYVAEIINQ